MLNLVLEKEEKGGGSNYLPYGRYMSLIGIPFFPSLLRQWENEAFLINAVIMMGPTVDLCPFRLFMNVPDVCVGVKVGRPDRSLT